MAAADEEVEVDEVGEEEDATITTKGQKAMEMRQRATQKSNSMLKEVEVRPKFSCLGSSGSLHLTSESGEPPVKKVKEQAENGGAK